MHILSNLNGIRAIENGDNIDYKITIIFLSFKFTTLKELKEKISIVAASELHFHIRGKNDFIVDTFVNYKPFELPPLKGKWKLLFQDHTDITQTFSLAEALQYKEPVIYIVEEEYEIPNGPKTYKRIDIARF